MSIPEDQEKWAYYPLYLREREGSCLVNLSAPDADPTPQLVRVILTFEVEPCEDNAFGSREERDELESLVEGFDGSLKSHCQGIWVGQLREPGKLIACFYCAVAPSNEFIQALEAPLRTAAKRFQLEVVEDSDWTFYFDELMPTPLAAEWTRNESVEASLRRNGDPMTTPREVAHWAYFASEPSAQKFILEISKENFNAEKPEHQTGENARTGQEWCVRFKRDDLPTADELAPITLSLRQTAEDCGGEYDGWETAVLDA